MANNRMFLVHVPTGLAIFLGKRMGWGWYSQGGGVDINTFFEVLDKDYGYEGRQDHFSLVMEDDIGAPACSIRSSQWQYGRERGDGLTQLIIETTD